MVSAVESRRGSLVIVGTGIKADRQTTPEAREAIESADSVLYAVADRRAAAWIRALHPGARPLEYDRTQPRRRLVYEKMVDRILEELHKGGRLCVVFYGHPGVFAYAPHRSLRRAREEGYRAVMLPGVSAEDCLLADLGVDPATMGCQSYEATDFLIRPRSYDISTALVLWQVGSLGNLGFRDEHAVHSPSGLSILVETLAARYELGHRVYLYEASTDLDAPPRIESLLLAKLASARVSEASTLFVPAKRAAALDQAMMDRLGVRFDSPARDPEEPLRPTSQ